MVPYEEKALRELRTWQRNFSAKPSAVSSTAKKIQNRINSIIPDKAHKLITETIKNMVRVVLLGSEFTTARTLVAASLEEREKLVKEKLNFYKKAAAIEGGGTGGAGFLLGMADFPLLLSIKIKFLYDVASLFGFETSDYKERLFILYIFQLAFSSRERANEIYKQISDWDNYIKSLPLSIDSFDWRTFQQEYRDYMDLAKLLQLVPGIGMVIGAYANYKLMNKLGDTAINAYRMRILIQH